MLCPGVYPPDPTLGITDPQMLPPPKLVPRSRNYEHRPCPDAASPAPGTGSSPAPCMIWATRWGAGPATSSSPTPSITAPGAATISPPTCPTWPRPRPATPIGSWLWPFGWWWRTAYPIRPPVGTSGATIGSSSPSPPSRTGWRPGGKKAADRIGADYLDWALDGFSGYIAADELYDGPFCVLSIVDNRAFQRLCYEVLDHPPAHGDIRAFFQRFQAALAGRGLTLRGITTDGSELYPQPISEVFGAVEHQVCRFHILAELNKAVLRAVAQVRKHLAAQKPTLPRGRPGTPEAKRKARRRRHLERKIGDLFEHRHLFVRRHLTPGERRTLQRISRGLPQLRALRGVVEEIHRLFDRRCRTETALTKLARLRAQRPPLQGIGADLPEAPVPQLGEGADLPGRSPAGFDLQRRGTGQPPASQDAEDGVPGPNSSRRSAAGSRWTCFATPKVPPARKR